MCGTRWVCGVANIIVWECVCVCVCVRACVRVCVSWKMTQEKGASMVSTLYVEHIVGGTNYRGYASPRRINVRGQFEWMVSTSEWTWLDVAGCTTDTGGSSSRGLAYAFHVSARWSREGMGRGMGGPWRQCKRPPGDA